MRVVVLWAQQDSPNLGLHALAVGGAEVLRTAWPHAEVQFQNYGRGTAPRSIGSPKALVRDLATDHGGIRSWIRGFDMAFDLRSGDSFTDIYGLDRLATMSAMAEFAHRAGTPVVLGPQTIGPFRTRRGRMLARRSLRTAVSVMSRDPDSSATAAALGRPVDLMATDVVFALPVPERTARRDILLNVSGLLWNPNPHVDHTHYRRCVARLHEGLLRRGRAVHLLAHVLESSSADNDLPALKQFRAAHAPDAEIIVPGSLPEVRRIIAGSRLVIGARMHACLNALSCGVPAVAMAYSRKFGPLLEPLGWSATVDLRTAVDPAGAVLAAVDADDLEARAGDVRRRADVALSSTVNALRALSLP